MNKERLIEQKKLIETLLKTYKDKKNGLYFFVPNPNSIGKANMVYIYRIALNCLNSGFKVIMLHDKTYTKPDTFNVDISQLPHMPFEKATLGIADVLFLPEGIVNTFRDHLVESKINVLPCEVCVIAYNRYNMYADYELGKSWLSLRNPNVPFRVENVIVSSQTYISLLKEQPEIAIGSKFHYIPPVVESCFTPTPSKLTPYVAVMSSSEKYATEFIKSFLSKYPECAFIGFKFIRNQHQGQYAHELKQCAAVVWIEPDTTTGFAAVEAMKAGIPVIGRVPELIPEWMLTTVNDEPALRQNGYWVTSMLSLPTTLHNFIQEWLVSNNQFNPVMVNIQVEASVTASAYSEEYQKLATQTFITDMLQKREEKILSDYEKINKEIEKIVE